MALTTDSSQGWLISGHIARLDTYDSSGFVDSSHFDFGNEPDTGRVIRVVVAALHLQTVDPILVWSLARNGSN